jgi:hypothetical protein
VLTKEAGHSDVEVRSPIVSSATGLVSSRLQVSFEDARGKLINVAAFPKRRSGFTANAALSFGWEHVAVLVSQGAALLDRVRFSGHQNDLPTMAGRSPTRAPSLPSRSCSPTTRHGTGRPNSGTTHGHGFGTTTTTTTHAVLLNAKHRPFFLHSTYIVDSTISCSRLALHPPRLACNQLMFQTRPLSLIYNPATRRRSAVV